MTEKIPTVLLVLLGCLLFAAVTREFTAIAFMGGLLLGHLWNSWRAER